MPYLTIPRNIRTFALIWFGQLISSLGSGLTAFGLSVYLFQETGSAAQFALNSFLYVLAISLVAYLHPRIRLFEAELPDELAVAN